MTSHTTPSAPARPNGRSSDGRYAHVGAYVMVGTAAGTLIALWLYPVVVCAVWAGMLAMLGLMTLRPAAAPAVA